MSRYMTGRWTCTVITIVSTLALAAIAAFAPVSTGVFISTLTMACVGAPMSVFMVRMNLRDRRNRW